MRFALLGIEVASRPLYPWDAWTQWATKARVWYELGYLAPFARVGRVVRRQWRGLLRCVARVSADDAAAAGVDLSHARPLGRRADELALVADRRRARASPSTAGCARSASRALAALVGAFLVASLPLANVHVALAGYADLPLAACYAAAALALLRWAQSRDLRDAALALLLAVACTQIKNPGWFWAVTLVPAAVVVLLPRYGVRVALVGFAVGGLRARRAGAHEDHPVQLPDRPRLRSAVGRPGRRAIFCSATGICSGTARSSSRSSPAGELLSRSARADDDDRARRIAVPVLRVRLHQRERVHLRSDHGEPRDASSGAAHRVFMVLAFQAFARRWRAARPRAAPAADGQCLYNARASPAPPPSRTLFAPMPLFALTIFASAFLLFLVQPIVAKQILPWFGGSAAVWATCLVFFQTTLLLGYAYADFIGAPLHAARAGQAARGAAGREPRRAADHAGRVLEARGRRESDLADPGLARRAPSACRISCCRRRARWCRRGSRGAFPGRNPYRLFALSNLASLLALLGYPFLLEPWVATRTQAWGWSAGYATLRRRSRRPPRSRASSRRGGRERSDARPRRRSAPTTIERAADAGAPGPLVRARRDGLGAAARGHQSHHAERRGGAAAVGRAADALSADLHPLLRRQGLVQRATSSSRCCPRRSA